MMSDRGQTVLRSPTTRCRFGIGRVDITPPVGIYHRLWGAARHDRATGVHRPLTATALVVASLDAEDDSPELFVAIDHCLLRPTEMDDLLRETSARTGLSRDRMTIAFSHTHSGGNVCRSRAELPGGELIGAYLDELPGKIDAAFRTAARGLAPAVITYAPGAVRCDMGRNRDFAWTDDRARQSGEGRLGEYLCGLNPRADEGLPVGVARVSRLDGSLVTSLVNYPCHPTTLAWDNPLISPDYVGALRETVERNTGAPCVFLLSPCGDIGPKEGFVGDVAVADRNGRQVGFAALSALESMGPPGADYHFAGPVLSGATIGTWEYRPHDAARRRATSVFRNRRWRVELPYRSDLPGVADVQSALAEYAKRESAARLLGDSAAERDARALAERQRRLLERIEPLPAGPRYPLALSVWQLGDAFWIAVEGEPYHALQQAIECRFPQVPIVFVTLANGLRPSYLPRREDYGKRLYQVDIALLAAGALETLIDEIGGQIAAFQEAGG